MIELDRNIGHNSVISIRELFIDRYEPAYLVDQVIHVMELTGDTIAEGANGMYQPRFECHSICFFLMDTDVEPPCHTADR